MPRAGRGHRDRHGAARSRRDQPADADAALEPSAEAPKAPPRRGRYAGVSDEERAEIEFGRRPAVARLQVGTGDERVRQRLILHYSPLVKHRRRSRRCGPAAQHRAGRPGLVRHLRAHRRDPEVRPRAGDQVRDVYAISRMRAGAIIDELRSIDWIPRSVRYKARRGREGLRRAGGVALHPHPDRGPRWPPSWASRWRTCTRSSARSASCDVVALDELLTSGRREGRRALAGRHARGRQGRGPRSRSFESEEDADTCSRRRSTRCPSGRRSS